MKIGELADRAGVNVQTVRYYERRRLLEPPGRTGSGYRDYGGGAVDRIRFIRRAQNLGFTLEEIRDLLGLWADSERSCTAAEQRASATLDRIAAKIRDLQQMSAALGKYVSACRERSPLPGCPLLAALGRSDDDHG